MLLNNLQIQENQKTRKPRTNLAHNQNFAKREGANQKKKCLCLTDRRAIFVIFRKKKAILAPVG